MEKLAPMLKTPRETCVESCTPLINEMRRSTTCCSMLW